MKFIHYVLTFIYNNSMIYTCSKGMMGRVNSNFKFTNGKIRKEDGTITRNNFRRRVIKGSKMINRVSTKIGHTSANKNSNQPM